MHASEFPIIPSKTAMLFFDCLSGGLHPEDPEKQAIVNGWGIFEPMQRINEASRGAGIPIFYTQIDHRPDLKDIAPLVIGFGPDGTTASGPSIAKATTATPGTWRQEVVPEIAPQPHDYITKKQRWSAFYETNFRLNLQTLGVDTIMIAGGHVEIGVISTAYSARDRDYNVILLRDAIYCGREGVKDFLMDRVFPVFARVMTVDEAIALIQKP
jgi:ureidoacrylate peracid hydrolase